MLIYNLVVFCITFCFCASKISDQEILDSILDGYEERLRPNSGGEPLFVNSTMYVVSIGPVSEVDMTFKLSLYFRQYWRDNRLAYNSSADTLVLSQDVQQSLWIPDSFFQTETDSYVHDVTKQNVFFHLNPSGDILMSMRVTITSRCPMYLIYFPMDNQKCALRVASWGYTADDIQYRWSEAKNEDDEPIEISPDITLANFKLLNKTYYAYTRTLSTGNWSTLVANFEFGRNTLYFIIQMYIPSTLIVTVSWVSFWVSRTALPARAALGITTVLTLLTLISSTNANMPKISYMKAIDVYLAGCFLFVFASLIEFALVCYLDQHEDIEKPLPEKPRYSPKYEVQELLHSDIVLIRKPTASNDCQKISIEHESEKCGYDSWNTNTKSKAKCPRGNHSHASRMMQLTNSQPRVATIDHYSRCFFPIAFFSLKIVYWSYYWLADIK